jgi:hypothetical protein
MYIPIYNRKKELVCKTRIDKEDYPKIKQYLWNIMGKGYIKSKIGEKHVYLHRFVMNETDPTVKIDHINNDPLDNRKCNLRRVTMRENAFNRTKPKNTSSQYKGVSFNKQMNKYVSYIKLNGIKYQLGSFEKEKDAAKIYNDYAKLLFHSHYKPNKIK